MARERRVDVREEEEDPPPQRRKKGRKVRGGKRTVVAYCPNRSNSRSFSRSKNMSTDRWPTLSKTALKKNNEELAKGLNKYKQLLALKEEELIQLRDKNLEQNHENAVLRTQTETIFRSIKSTLNPAFDHIMGLQEQVSQAMSITNRPLRASQASRASSIGLSTLGSFRGRVAVINKNTSGQTSPSKQLPQSKVSPMVAGHPISRPRIQLTRMDLSSVANHEDYVHLTRPEAQPEDVLEAEAANEQDPTDVDERLDPPDVDEQTNPGQEDIHDQEPGVVEGSPEEPRRTMFNMTVIGEEIRVEESPVSGEESRLEESPVLMQDVEEEREEAEAAPEQDAHDSILRRVQRNVPRLSRKRLSGLSLSPNTSRVSIGSTPGTSGAHNQRTTSNTLHAPDNLGLSTSSRSPNLRGFSANLSPNFDNTCSPARSPAVKILERSSRYRNRELSSSNMSLVETPLAAPSPPRPSQPPPTNINLEDFENPSDSFLESLGCGPEEGPSWLFGSVGKKKKRKSVAKRLSTLLSDEPSSCRSSMESLNSSDITADASEESGFLRSGEEGASGFLGLSNRISDSPGLAGSSRLLPRVSITPRDTISPEKTRRFLQSLGMDTGEDLLDQSEEGEIHDDQLQRSADRRMSDDHVLVDAESRTPLREFVSEPLGEVLTYNPRLETGRVIPNFKQARILIKNTSSAPVLMKSVPLSDCYIDLSPGRRFSVEAVMNLGLSTISPLASFFPAQREEVIPDSYSPELFGRCTPEPEASKLSPNLDTPSTSKKHNKSSEPCPSSQLDGDSILAVPQGSSPGQSRQSGSSPVHSRQPSISLDHSRQSDSARLTNSGRSTKAARPVRASRVQNLNLEESMEEEHQTTSVDDSRVESELTKQSARLKRKQLSEPLPSKRKRRDEVLEDDTGLDYAPKKKARSTITKGCKVPEAEEEEDEESVVLQTEEAPESEEGCRKSRRAASQISFKEPSLRGKMRQGDSGSSSVYSDFKPQSKPKNKKLKK